MARPSNNQQQQGTATTAQWPRAEMPGADPAAASAWCRAPQQVPGAEPHNSSQTSNATQSQESVVSMCQQARSHPGAMDHSASAALFHFMTRARHSTSGSLPDAPQGAQHSSWHPRQQSHFAACSCTCSTLRSTHLACTCVLGAICAVCKPSMHTVTSFSPACALSSRSVSVSVDLWAPQGPEAPRFPKWQSVHARTHRHTHTQTHARGVAYSTAAQGRNGTAAGQARNNTALAHSALPRVPEPARRSHAMSRY